MTTTATKISELDKRLRTLVEANTRKTRRNADLEELTQISASQWASWWAGRARPSSEMLAALCVHWPESSLWLMTGADDFLGGQVSPYTEPERKQEAATRYLRRLVEITDQKIGSRSEGGGDDLSEWEVDELNSLWRVRARELQRRLPNNDDKKV